MTVKKLQELIDGAEFTRRWWAGRESPEKAKFFEDIATALRELQAVKANGLR